MIRTFRWALSAEEMQFLRQTYPTGGEALLFHCMAEGAGPEL